MSEDINEANEWLNKVEELIRGEEGIEGRQVRVIASSVVRGLAIWLKSHSLKTQATSSLMLSTESLIRELETWQI